MKSHIQNPAGIVFGLLITILIVSGSYKAQAAPQPLPFNFPVPEQGMLEWMDIQEVNFCFGDDVPGLNMGDAYDSQGNDDAYDNAWNTSIDDTPLAPIGTGDLTDRTYTSVPQNISGLDVTAQYFFSEDTQCHRYIVFLENNTGGTINETVRLDTNFGSDEETTIEGTSSGDLTFTTADRWLVTSDTEPLVDPVLTNVFYGPGNPEVTTSFASLDHCPNSSEAPLDDGFAVEFDVSVPQNQTQCLMMFGCLADITGPGNTIDGALMAAPLFDSNDTIPGDLLSGLSQQQLVSCVNWDFGEIAQIPTLSEWGLIAFVVLAGAVAVFVLRRRSQTA